MSNLAHAHDAPSKNITSSILDCIGNTPLLDLGDGLYAKAEFFNPSGSIKARMAHYMIEKAEKEGLLKPGDTIVESTSGNTGNALSMIAAVKGYKMIVVMPSGYTSERSRISRGYGAEIRYVGHFSVDEARSEAIRLGKQDGFYCPQQFDNEWNVEENKEWLAPEIVAQLPDDLKIDAIVQGVGTGGTLVGVGIGMQEQHNPDLKIFAMEPSESRTLGCCIAAEHKIEGIADGFVPSIYDRYKDSIAGIIDINSDAAIAECKRLSAMGIFVGPSSGANVLAARQIQRDNDDVTNVLTFLCDRGEKYLTMLYP